MAISYATNALTRQGSNLTLEEEYHEKYSGTDLARKLITLSCEKQKVEEDSLLDHYTAMLLRGWLLITNLGLPREVENEILEEYELFIGGCKVSFNNEWFPLIEDHYPNGLRGYLHDFARVNGLTPSLHR
jgi:hypothetical protein